MDWRNPVFRPETNRILITVTKRDIRLNRKPFLTFQNAMDWRNPVFRTERNRILITDTKQDISVPLKTLLTFLQ
jgi:hypothetical protein